MAVVDQVTWQKAREAVDFISQFGRVRAAYLFGSHADGTAHADSDIDIGAFIEGLEDWDLNRRIHVTVETQKHLGDILELHFFPAASFESPAPASFAAYVKKRGIALTG